MQCKIIVMSNLRFATAIHILVLTEKFKNQLITSEFIAGSININPVVVRREIKFLREAGLIGAKKGKEGGCFLAKDPNDILIGDVYRIVNQENTFAKLNQTNPICPIGKQMNENLEDLFNKAERDLISSLNKKTLKEFSNEFE
ncbi:DNA-binding transcriptional regulator, IscR family [Chishuiella changwenlii]|uniref:DNA-binding transcriptional regulator, IscR family n=2 Tax=Chishuiella changwenlii TaxID=1434701 RepID=A0A1M6WW02_9FLAO|nr:DNA-binding transcriptional regulator, IscR family [Chishuiella changwenlii]